MKNAILFQVLAIFLLTGCKTGPVDDSFLYRPEVSFTISDHLFPEKVVKCIDVVDDDNYCWSSGNELYIREYGQESWVALTSEILDLSRNPVDNSLWAGTYSSGLARISKGQVNWFTGKSHGLPRDLIRQVVCDDSGRVWFNSSAHRLGGLGCYDNGAFHFYTPDNSVLPDNLIKSIATSGNKVYVATGGYVTQQKVLEISDDGWKLLPITGYYLMDMDASSRGTLYVIDDVSLSSSSFMTNSILRFHNDSVVNILPDESRFYSHPYRLKADLRDYLWVARFTQDETKTLTVFDDECWQEPPEGFPCLFVNDIAVDRTNAIWLATKTGIYILRQ